MHRSVRGGLLFAFVTLLTASCALLRAGGSPPAAGSSQSSAPSVAATGILPSLAEVTQQVRPAVVSVTTQDLSVGFFMEPIQQEGAGSGVIFDQQGHIMTNNHVVEGARNIRVTLADGQTFTDVRVVGKDPLSDVAVLQITGQGLPIAQLGESDTLRVGDWVIAIGNALGLRGGPTVTVGVVGALNRSIGIPQGALHDLIQTDAAINPGNSGGPLVDMAGRVVGINTAINTEGQGIGYALSINSVKPIVQQILQNGRVIRPWIGVSVATIEPGVVAELELTVKEGVLIVGVQRGTPADRAGLRAGDVITHLDGQKVVIVQELQEAIWKRNIGEEVKVNLIREGKAETSSIKLEEMPRGLEP